MQNSSVFVIYFPFQNALEPGTREKVWTVIIPFHFSWRVGSSGWWGLPKRGSRGSSTCPTAWIWHLPPTSCFPRLRMLRQGCTCTWTTTTLRTGVNPTGSWGLSERETRISSGLPEAWILHLYTSSYVPRSRMLWQGYIWTTMMSRRPKGGESQTP